MSKYVVTEVSLKSGSLLTHITTKRTLLSMSAYILIQVTVLPESFLTRHMKNGVHQYERVDAASSNCLASFVVHHMRKGAPQCRSCIKLLCYMKLFLHLPHENGHSPLCVHK